MTTVPKVIECANHQFAPWAVLCIHLIENPKLQWISVEVDDGREVENDYICAECYKQHMSGNDPVDDIRPICIHCVRKLKNEN